MAGCKFDLLVCVGPQAKLIKDAAIAGGMEAARVIYFADSAAAAAEARQWARAGDLVLLKGSRGMKLERIAIAIASMGGAADVTRKSA